MKKSLGSWVGNMDETRKINGFDDRNIEEEQERLVRNNKGKKYNKNIEDNFWDYLARVNKEREN